MNLSEALDAALPEIPQARLSRSRPPRLDPDLVTHEDVLDGEPIVGILQRDRANYFRFPPLQWQLAQLFDGERSYEEIAEAFQNQTGVTVAVEEVRAFAEQMDECDFWYKSHQEKNLAMRDKLLNQRGRRTKSKINVAHISFSAWDPDRYLGWLDGVAGAFIYSRWCVLTVLVLFVFETAVVIQNWGFIGPDTALFFNFTQKSLGDFAQFWLLIMVVGFLHETAHGLTCKHFGGQVHSMGLMFLYFVPCFFVDVTESWVAATKIQRLATIIAGIWIELVVCGIAMILWLNTPEGGWFHNFAYEIILLTGIAAVAINLNPLIKLDGYYFLTEVIEIPELKERSTAFLSAWFQARVLRLPIDVPIVPRRRVVLFAIYAFLSGLYSYLLLFFVVRLSYRLGSKWLGEFALIPSAALAFALYRSRLRSLRRVMKGVWMTKLRNALQFRPTHLAAGMGALILLFIPLLRDRENAFFVIEPSATHTISAAVPGRVEAVLVREGERVTEGTPLLRISSNDADSMHSAALAQGHHARFAAFEAQLRGQSIGGAAASDMEAQKMGEIAEEAKSSLEVRAPADGTVVTEDPSLLTDRNVASGEPLLVVAEGMRIARIFIPTSSLDKIRSNSEVALALPGQFSTLRLPLSAPSGEPVSLPAGLVASEKFQGIRLPVFYTAWITLPSSIETLRFGTSGTAKIYGERRSVAGWIAMEAADLVKAHIW